jgi:membrane protein
MASIKQRLADRVERIRRRRPLVDHLLSTLGHYGAVDGNGQAGAVTYFGFLSFFPILALGFFVIGLVAQIYPDARADLVTSIDKVLPGMIGTGEGQVRLRLFEDNAGTVGAIGLAGVLYSGLGWLSGMRNAFEAVFVLPRREQPGFVVGKARDLATLALLGVVLIVSVALSGAVAGFSAEILGWLGLDPDTFVPQAVVWLVGHTLAIVSTTLLLVAMFRLLADPQEPRRALVRGALLGAVGFELMKMLANFLIGHTKGQPAFQAFGVALILVVWINYFSRLVLYAAAWAYTSPVAVEQRARQAVIAPGAALPDTEHRALAPVGPAARARDARAEAFLLTAAAAVGAALAMAVRRLRAP